VHDSADDHSHARADADVRIRPAVPDDAAAIRRIYAPYIRASPATFRTEVPSTGEIREQIAEKRAADEYPWYVAVADGIDGIDRSHGRNATDSDDGSDATDPDDGSDATDPDHTSGGSTVVGYAYGSRLRDRPAYRWTVETSVYVDRDAQRSGIGTRLYDRLLDTLREQGYCAAYAALGMPNPESAAFHERHGFERVGEFPAAGFKLGEWRDVVWYHRRLREPDGEPDDPRPVSAGDGEYGT